MSRDKLSRQTAIVGVGATRFEKQPSRTGMGLLADAFVGALKDSGLEKDEIDGLIVHIGSPGGQDVDRVAEVLGLNVRYAAQPWAHGMWTGSLVAEAAMAVYCGLASCVLVGRGVSQTAPYGLSGQFGGERDPEGFREGGGLTAEMAHVGMTSPGAGAALAIRRYFSRYGGSSEDLAPIAIALRKHASLNPTAALREPISTQDHQASPWVVEPLRRLDYCQVSDGAACVLITSVDRARQLGKPPAVIAGVQGLHVGRNDFVFGIPGLGVQQQEVFDHEPALNDLHALHMAGLTHRDVQGFYTYDAFTPLVAFALERYGFARQGDALRWLRDGRIELGGELPVNTNGGLHSEGHSGGWGAIVEMVRQLRNEAGARQIEGASALFWGPVFGNSVVLTSN